MKYFYLEPEVAGGLGENTVLDASTHPPRIDILHYCFDGWLGDAILESFPCFIVTDAAADALIQMEVTGIQLADVEVSVSPTFQSFEELYPGRVLPHFRWLKVHGLAGIHDFGVAARCLRLVVSEKVLLMLKSLGIAHADIEDFIEL